MGTRRLDLRLEPLSGPLGNQGRQISRPFATCRRVSGSSDPGRETTVCNIGARLYQSHRFLLDYIWTPLFTTPQSPYLEYQLRGPQRRKRRDGFGYKVATNVAVTVGLSFGSQFQQQFTRHHSDYTNIRQHLSTGVVWRSGVDGCR